MGAYFRGAPITLCLCSTVVLGTLLTGSLPRLYDALSLTSAASVLSYRAELWRLLTSSLLLSDSLPAAGLSAYLLYHLRLFERQMGSSKFGAYVTVCTLVDIGARAAFLAIPRVGSGGVAAGPFHIIFGLLPLYFRACEGGGGGCELARRRPRGCLLPSALPWRALTLPSPPHTPPHTSLLPLLPRRRTRAVPRCPDHPGPSAV